MLTHGENHEMTVTQLNHHQQDRWPKNLFLSANIYQHTWVKPWQDTKHMKLTSQSFPILIKCVIKIQSTVLVVLHWRLWQSSVSRYELISVHIWFSLDFIWTVCSSFHSEGLNAVVAAALLFTVFLSQHVWMLCTGLTHPAGITKPCTAPCDCYGCHLIKAASRNITVAHVIQEIHGKWEWKWEKMKTLLTG